MSFEEISTVFVILIPLGILFGLLVLQIVILRWIFRVNEIVSSLHQIRDLLASKTSAIGRPTIPITSV